MRSSNPFSKLPCGQLALVLLMFAAALVHVGSAQADCKAFSGLPQFRNYNMSVVVPDSLPAGATIPGTYRPFNMTGACTSDAYPGRPSGPALGSRIVACTVNGTASPVPGIPGVYTTGIAGVGMALLDASGNRLLNAQTQLCASNFGLLEGGGTAPYTLTYNLAGAIELVKTSPAGTPVSSGTLTSGNAAWLFGVYDTGWVLNYYAGGNLDPSKISPLGNLQVSSVTCTVTSPSTVTLPKVGLSALSSPGAVAGGTPFNIGLVCNKDLQVGIRMEAAAGTPVVDPATGGLGSQGTAQGVGIQLLKSDFSPMPLNQRVDLGSISANGQVNYGYFAQYKRIGSPLTPGTVQSQMVFTFEYQ
ncbi:Fimbrial protein [compost metagenome]